MATANWHEFYEDSNDFKDVYVQGFVDLSGILILRNETDLIVNGNLTLANNLTINNGGTMSMNNIIGQSNIFMGEDVSINGNLYVGGDLSLIGQFNCTFANGVIPYSTINFSSAGTAEIQGNLYIAEDISFNSTTTTTVELSSSTYVNADSIQFSNDNVMTTYNDNILSGSYANNNVVFKNSTFVSVTCLGTATASVVAASSDYRIKTNVTELDDSYTVDNLNPVEYNNLLSKKYEYGFIAHELQSVYPHMVIGEKDGEEYQRVMYNDLIGISIKEIKDLKHRIDKLTTA